MDIHCGGCYVIWSRKRLTFSNEEDMNYLISSVRLVNANMWDASENEEETRHNLWPLPSHVFI